MIFRHIACAGIAVGFSLANGQPTSRTPPKPASEVQALLDAAEKQPKPSDRISILKAAVATAAQLHDDYGEAFALNRIGRAESNAGQPQIALEYFGRAYAIRDRIGDRKGEAGTLLDEGIAYVGLGQPARAREFYDKALPIYRSIGERNGEAAVLYSIGNLFSTTGRPAEALPWYQQALGIARETGTRYLEHLTQTSFAGAFSLMGKPKEALAASEQALQIERQNEDVGAQANTLSNMATLCFDIGQPQRALEMTSQAITAARKTGNTQQVGDLLTTLAALRDELGQVVLALGDVRESLAISRKFQNRPGEARALNIIGECYYSLANPRQAIYYFDQALEIARQIRDRDREDSILCDIGTTYSSLRDWNRAIEFLNQAIQVERDMGNREPDLTALNSMGIAYFGAGQYAKALDYYSRSLSLARSSGNRRMQAVIWSNIGETRAVLGQAQSSRVAYKEALRLEREVGNANFEAITLSELAVLNEKQDPDLAIWYGKRAIKLYQGLRQNIRGLDIGARMTFTESVSNVYRRVADLLARRGRVAEAEQVLRLLKDDELYEYVRRSDAALAGGSAEYTKDEAAWDAEYEKRTLDLADVARRVDDLAKEAKPDAAKLSALQTKLDEGEKGFDEFLDRVLERSRTLKVSETRLDKIRNAQTIAGTLTALHAPGTVAVYALAAPDALRLFFYSPSGSLARVTNIKEADLNLKVLAFREALTDPKLDPRPIGKQLYDLLIAPIEHDLNGAHAKRIMWSLDGQLRYIPMAALWDGKQFLIERYEMSIFDPAAGTGALEREAPSAWRALVAGVSRSHDVKNDDGTTDHFLPLGNVPQELDSVARALPGTKELLDGEFTLNKLKESLIQHPNVVHLATHFSFRPGDETKSYLLTGDGKPLRVADARTLSTIYLRGVSLLTLSACETALGGSDGSEVEGISAVLQKKGAEAVIATLWPVADSSTASLMAQFYRLRRAHPEWSKLRALQTAQIWLMRGQSSANTTAVRSALAGRQAGSSTTWPTELPRFAHPYYWAPFVLMGNWK
jgi:CHAT domain-containing protein/Tfp pilus assembly protein PilF